MPQPLIAALPKDLVLPSGYVIRIAALAPTDGSAVTGVRVTDLAFQVRPVTTSDVGGTIGDVPSPLLVPTDETG